MGHPAMKKKQKLLIVDDEAVVCKACQRVLTREGLRVEISTDACQGLNWAEEKDYDGIILDVKMPGMNGIHFLEKLREKKPDVPVMIMTGYPSMPDMEAALRLGASDYVTKPFTPEEITQAVKRMLKCASPDEQGRLASASEVDEADVGQAGPEEFQFLGRSWVQIEEDGSARVGAVLTGSQMTTAEKVRLPAVGDVLYQGLPLAAVIVDGSPQVIISAAVSGVVVAVNGQLADNPSLLWTDPCREGWIACVCTTRFEEEISTCRPRHIILANADDATAQDQRERLTALGCQVALARNYDEVVSATGDRNVEVMAFDVDSFGKEGPQLVEQVNTGAPDLKIVAIASSASLLESVYRARKIFYFAVEPFADNEIVEILDAAFRPRQQTIGASERRAAASRPVHGICVTNRNKHRVHLLSAPGILYRNEGLGRLVHKKLTDLGLDFQTDSGDADVTPTEMLAAASACDRVMMLRTEDTGRLPGTLTHDTKAEFKSPSGEAVIRITTLAVQPDSEGTGLAGLDDQTLTALAEHIVREMASY